MRKIYIPFLLLGAFVMNSCGKQIPSDIIQPDEMENLLYDYHLALSMGSDLPNVPKASKEGMKMHALAKHHVTTAEFDSSMVWYTRHANFLYEIYANLEKRYLMDENRMKSHINKRNGQISISLSGDSVDIWSDRDLYWLSSSVLTNKVTFNLKADTTFRPLDELCLEANFTFFAPDSLRKSEAVVGLSVRFSNDSIRSLVKTVTESGKQTFRLKPDSAFYYRNVTGFIYCNATDSVSGDVLVNGIRLMRYHDDSQSGGVSEKQGEGKKHASRRASRLSMKETEFQKVQPMR